MSNPNWWNLYLKHVKALRTSEKQAPAFTEKVNSTLRIFSIAIENEGGLAELGAKELTIQLRKAETLLKELQKKELETGHPKKRAFFGVFAKATKEGIEFVRKSANLKSIDDKKTDTSNSAKTKPLIYSATSLGKEIVDLKRQYMGLMEQAHEEKSKSVVKDSGADEADRLNGFLDIAAYWLQQLQALEFASHVLQENLTQKAYPIEKKRLPLQFRLEQNSTSHTFRLVKANNLNPYPEDISILDVFNNCFDLPISRKNESELVDNPDVIRFVRLHSQEDQLLAFKSDQMSKIADQLYKILLDVIHKIKTLTTDVVTAINLTPFQDLEFAFADINPEECRSLLRKKFQSMLPGINEKRFRESQGKKQYEKSLRTQELMEDYTREFQSEKEKILETPKSCLATAYWLRRSLMSILKNNISLEKKKKSSQSTLPQQQKFIVVGTSLTIGDEDISKFNVDPDDVFASDMSIQRIDRTDKWIAVRKSEKTHRLYKKDFFGIVKKFVKSDLNPRLQYFGFREIDLDGQLLPEIHERLADETRIEILRSSILGTVITNLDEFKESTEFQKTFIRYFKKPEYNNIDYPEGEKLSVLARELVNSSTSILQMKYRKVLKVKEEINQRLDELKHVVKSEAMSSRQEKDFRDEFKQTRSFVGILGKIQEILIYAKPSLKDVKLAPSSDVMVFKAD